MKVLLIEDAPEIVKGVSLTFKLRWADAVVVPVTRGGDADMAVETESPDIIILDINLPDITGFEVIENIRHFSDVPIIVLSVRDGDVDMLRALEMGADDYIVKPFSPANLLIRVKAVLRRTGMHDDDIERLPPLVAGNITIDFGSKVLSVNNEPVHLTPNERKTLYCLARNEGRLVSLETLKRQIWGSDTQYIDGSAIKGYIYQLRMKLGDSAEQPRIILNERGSGYRFVNPGKATTDLA